MNLDIGSVGNVRAREDRNRPPEAKLLGEVMKVELSMLQAEVTERACRLQAALDEALDAGRLFGAVEDVSLSGELLLHALLLFLLINRECLAQIDLF